MRTIADDICLFLRPPPALLMNLQVGALIDIIIIIMSWWSYTKIFCDFYRRQSFVINPKSTFFVNNLRTHA